MCSTDFFAKGTRFYRILAPQPASLLACHPTTQRASQHVLPVGWAGNVSESVRFRIKINTILAEVYFWISRVPSQAATLRERLSP